MSKGLALILSQHSFEADLHQSGRVQCEDQVLDGPALESCTVPPPPTPRA